MNTQRLCACVWFYRCIVYQTLKTYAFQRIETHRRLFTANKFHVDLFGALSVCAFPYNNNIIIVDSVLMINQANRISIRNLDTFEVHNEEKWQPKPSWDDSEWSANFVTIRILSWV